MVTFYILVDVLKVSINRISTDHGMVWEKENSSMLGKVREYYFSSEKFDICRNVLRTGRNIWCRCDLISLMKREKLLKTYQF